MIRKGEGPYETRSDLRTKRRKSGVEGGDLGRTETPGRHESMRKSVVRRIKEGSFVLLNISRINKIKDREDDVIFGVLRSLKRE